MIAISASDSESAFGRLSEHPGALTIGTDLAEWWRGQEARLIWGRQIEELGGFPVAWDEIKAWEEGTVGWASVKFRLTWAEQTFDARATYVLHLEHGEWKEASRMRAGHLRGALSPQATQRQMDVLAAYVAAGGSVADAAELVGIRPGTVKRHLADLRARSGLTTEQLIYAGRPGGWLVVPSLERT